MKKTKISGLVHGILCQYRHRAYSTLGMSLAIGCSQRAVQRALRYLNIKPTARMKDGTPLYMADAGPGELAEYRRDNERATEVMKRV